MKKLLLLTVALAFGATASMAQSTTPFVLESTISEATSISVGALTGDLNFAPGETLSNQASNLLSYSTTAVSKEIQVSITSHHANTWDDLWLHLNVGVATAGTGTPGNRIPPGSGDHVFNANVSGEVLVINIGPTAGAERTMTYQLERDLIAAATYRGFNVTYTIL